MEDSGVGISDDSSINATFGRDFRSPALPSTAPYEHYVHENVYALGRKFEFQAYNVDPETKARSHDDRGTERSEMGEVWSPSTIFVASDHLTQVLAKNMYVRNEGHGNARERFVMSLWEYHTKIFQPYKNWCNHVGLPMRPTAQADTFAKCEPYSDSVAYMLLNELALYKCIWTESANLKYMPELICFIYHVMRFSHSFEDVLQMEGKWSGSAVPTDPEADVPNIRCHREELRRKHWVPIYKMRQQSRPPTEELVAKYTGARGGGVDLAPIVLEIVINGDGGKYLDRVVQPLFHYLAYQNDELGGKRKLESICRINYDDVNESMTNKYLVHRTLSKLGVSGQKVKHVHNAYDEMVKLAESNGVEDIEKSVAWWTTTSFAKTFRERRSYLQIFRTFWRMFAFHAVLFHLLLVFAFYRFQPFKIYACVTLDTFTTETVKGIPKRVEKEEDEEEERQCESVPGLLAAYLSVVLTHAFLLAVERLVAGYLSSDVKDPSEKKTKKVRKRARFNDLEDAGHLLDHSKTEKKVSKGRPPTIPIEGAPFLTYVEGIIWFGVFLGLLAVFVLQFKDPADVKLRGFTKEDFELYWKLLSCGYIVVLVLHSMATTRDGYMISLTSKMSFGMLSRYSVRGKPLNEVYSPLKVTWAVFIWNLSFWVVTLMLKTVFDYFFIVRPLADALKALSQEAWLDNVFPNNNKIVGTSIFLPDDADFLLMIIRAIPSFCIVLVDTSVFYMLTSVAFGMMRGLLILNLGVVGNFNEAQNEFLKCPQQWWEKCVSKEGRKNIEDSLYHQRNISSAGDVERYPMGEEDHKKNGKKKNGKKKVEGNKSTPRFDEEMHDVFSDTWNQIVDDLREADLVSNAEQENLVYTKLKWHGSLHEHKLKPLMAPVFVFAGQMQKAVEVPRPSVSQIAIVQELRDLLLWMLAQFDIQDRAACEVMKTVYFLEEPFDRDHRIHRRNLLSDIRTFLDALLHLSKEHAGHPEAWSKGCESVRKAIKNVLKGLQHELNALNDKKKTKRLKLNPRPLKENIKNLDNFIEHIEKVALQEHGRLERCLWPLSKNGPPRDANLSEDDDDAYGQKASHKLIVEVINGVLKRITTTRVVATPSGREARQFLTFFVTSMFNPMLKEPPALVNMMSWTTLVPIFKEDVLYAIRADEIAREVGFPPPDLTTASPLTDLLTETDTRVSLLSYLRSVYPKDWANFLERLQTQNKIEIPQELTGEEFLQGGSLEAYQLDLVLWGSHRGQLLSRTIRGMMAYEKALKLIALLEHPRPEGMNEENYDLAISELVAAKFRCVVAAQCYGANKRGTSLKERWDAHALENLLVRYPHLRISYLDYDMQNGKKIEYAVLLRRMSPSQSGDLRPGEKPIEEAYRIRLPVNHFSGRGIIIGEGKPENQNHALPFAFGENLQTIDMNQDNFLLEALKMRNLLNELKFSEYAPKRKHPKTAQECQSKLQKRMEKSLIKKPILIGFREWIFSDKAGALGSFAAGTEFAFGTILQRVMTFPGRARFHYGHPDVWDKLWVMTRGGISKATRNLHVSEDVFGGFNAGLRGGKIAYRDYLSVGKGRDMGFVSINGFEIKISGGNGEVCISRDLYRLATRTDFFRMMSIYYSGPGFFINNAILMTTVYLQTWLLAVLALAGAYLLETGNPRRFESVFLRNSTGTAPAIEPETDSGRRLLDDMSFGRSLLQYDGTYEATDYSGYDGFRDNPPPEAPPPPVEPIDEYYPISYSDNSNPGSFSDGGAGSGSFGAPPRAPSQQVLISTPIVTDITDQNFTSVVRNVDTAVEITSIVQLGMLTVIAYIGELLLELGVLQTAALILLQVISGSLAFFIFKQQTDAAAFTEDMSYGGARYVGTGREFALMHNPFVMLYARYARTHFYFAMQLIVLCLMLLVLDVPGYASATFGSWMVALSLIFAPFWFNPVQFVMAQTKADYKQWTRWMQGEELDPDSKTTWYTWHDKKMAKVRNEDLVITDHWANAARMVVWNLVTNGLLAVAAISQIRTNADVLHISNLQDEVLEIQQKLASETGVVPRHIYDEAVQEIRKIQFQIRQAERDELGVAARNSHEKFQLWGTVSATIALSGLLLYVIFSFLKSRGHVTASRAVRVLSGFAFITVSVVFANIPDFLQTVDHSNGWRNLLLVYFANLNIAVFVIQVLQHTSKDHVHLRHIVDKAYHVMDYFIGILLFMVLFILSFTRFFAIIQNTLLYNVSVARSIQNRELVETIGIERVGRARDGSDDGDQKPSLTDRLHQLMDVDREGSITSSLNGSVINVTREGSFTRGDSLTRMQRQRSGELYLNPSYINDAQPRTRSPRSSNQPL